MAYTALYRKYRPDRFSDVVGQEHITKTLTNELKNGSVFHAYLFTGPRGTGKTSCAKILSKAINCEHPVNGDACCECESCRRIAAGDDLDIIEMDAASNRGIADINNIRDRVNYMPSMSKYRVFIVDEVHMLTTEAFNALLKTLEEPPAHIVFVLATTEVHKLPATILSRCQRFDFRRIDQNVVYDRIKYIAEKENISIDDDAAMLIAAMSDGGMRDALSTLDLCTATGEKITVQSVRSACALAGNEHLIKLADSIKLVDIGTALDMLDDLYKNSVDMQRLCEELASHYRNLMLAKTVPNYSKLIPSPPDELAAIKAQADEYRLPLIMLAIRVFGDARARMNNQNRRAELEMAIVKLCRPETDGGADSFEERISRLEHQLKSGVIPVNNQAPAAQATQDVNTAAQANSKPVEKIQEAQATPKPDSAKKEEKQPTNAGDAPAKTDGGLKPFGEWKRVLREITKTSPILAGGLNGSSAYIKNDTVLIDCENKVFLDMLRDQPVFSDSVKKALLDVTGQNLKIGAYTKAAAESAAPKSALDDIVNKLSELQVPDKYE